MIIDVEPTPPIQIPPDPLEKLIIGLVKNAVENTPDEGRVVVAVKNKEAQGYNFWFRTPVLVLWKNIANVSSRVFPDPGNIQLFFQETL